MKVTPTSGATDLLDLIEAYAEARHRQGHSSYNAQTATALQAVKDALAAGQATAAQQGVAYAALPTSSYAGRVYEEGFLIGTCPLYTADQMRAFADATHALRASHGQAYPTIGDLCARIKAADDAAADRDYMLDSNDCIAVLRGEWKGPLTMDKPERASHGQAPATQQVGEPECYKWEHYCRWGHGWGWGECESEYDPRLPENKQYHTEDFNDPEQVRNFRALYRHTPPSLPTAQAAQAASVQELHVGDSAFESWYGTYSPMHKSDKQRARDTYAAGMGDPLVTAATAAVAGPSWEALHHAWMKIGADVAGLHWGAFTNAVHYAPTTQPAPAVQGDALDAARYRLLRRGQHWSVIDGIGNDLRTEALDTAVDAARKQARRCAHSVTGGCAGVCGRRHAIPGGEASSKSRPCAAGWHARHQKGPTMKIKTKDLTGAALDWAVAKCAGYVEQGVYGTPEFRDGEVYLYYCDVVLNSCYSPTTNWAQGGPIIEREKIQTQWETFDTCDVMVGGWVATYCLRQSEWFQECGPAPLIAAMRCYVASKLGDEVDIPEGLL